MSRPISRRARTGFGPRVILRVVRSASRKAGSRSMRRARPSSRRRPSPVINTRSSHVPFTNQCSHAATGSASGASRMAIIGQGMASAPRSSSIRISWPSSRVSGTTIRRPLSSSVMPDLCAGVYPSRSSILSGQNFACLQELELLLQARLLLLTPSDESIRCRHWVGFPFRSQPLRIDNVMIGRTVPLNKGTRVGERCFLSKKPLGEMPCLEVPQ